MISEQVDVELAVVEVNDDYRVELWQFRRSVDYSPDQARDLALELRVAADQAEHQLSQQLEADAARARATKPKDVKAREVL